MAKSVIKLDVAETEGDEMVNNPYTCLTCNKSFSSGKAFGGHNRIHSLKKKEKKPIEVINLEFYEDKPTYYKCSICSKTFRTESSFKLHQTTHLRREEPKGTVEPSITASHTSTLSTTSTDIIQVQDGQVKLENGEEHNFSDMSNFLPVGWTKTGKRSLIAGGPERISTPEDERQAANDLIVLSQGAARAEDLPLEKGNIGLPPSEAMAYQREKTVLDYKHKGKGVAFVATSSGDVKEEIEEIEGDFICRKCNKSFASYQALGGHNSHHKKGHAFGRHNSHHKKAVNRESSVRFPTSNGSSSSNPAYAGGRWPYRCSFCNKTFKRSQALAGHRRHCRAPVPPAPVSLSPVTLTQVAVEEINEEAIVQVPKRAHLFDLNELPPPEDCDGIGDRNMLQPAEQSVLRLTWHERAGDPGSSSAHCVEEN